MILAFTRERERERERRICAFHNYDNIISVENLLVSWQEFLKGKRKRKDVILFSMNLMDNIYSLHNDLKNKTYRHSNYEAFKISDPKPRDIHKATVRDRLLHHAIYRILYPYFDKKFIFNPIGKASVKNTHVNHGVYVQSDTNSAMAESVSPKGLPLGNLTSQLLVNIYMNEFDQFVKHKLKVKYYIRYADDFVVLSENKEYLEKILERMKEFLETKLKLNLHPDKVFIKTIFSGVDFLGWIHFPKHRVLRTATKRRMFRNISGNPKPNTIQSYLGMLSHGNGYKLESLIEKILL